MKVFEYARAEAEACSIIDKNTLPDEGFVEEALETIEHRYTLSAFPSKQRVTLMMFGARAANRLMEVINDTQSRLSELGVPSETIWKSVVASAVAAGFVVGQEMAKNNHYLTDLKAPEPPENSHVE